MIMRVCVGGGVGPAARAAVGEVLLGALPPRLLRGGGGGKGGGRGRGGGGGKSGGDGDGDGARARARTIRDFLHRTCLICRPCHSEVHRLHDEMELAERFPTVERLLEDEDLVRFCKWASGQKCGRYSLSHG